jgi:hypothetical protein
MNDAKNILSEESVMHRRVVFLLAAIGLLAIFMVVSVSTRIAAAQSGRTSVGSQTPPSSTTVLQPQKWEYRILQDRDTARLEREANRLGEQGYEIFAFQIVQPYAGENRVGDAYFVMVLKRPKV